MEDDKGWPWRAEGLCGYSQRAPSRGRPGRGGWSVAVFQSGSQPVSGPFCVLPQVSPRWKGTYREHGIVTSAVLIPAASLRREHSGLLPPGSRGAPFLQNTTPPELELLLSLLCAQPLGSCLAQRPTVSPSPPSHPSQLLPPGAPAPVSSVSPTGHCSPTVRAGPRPSSSPAPHHP